MNPYLMMAERAIDYVHNTLRIQCSNRFEGINRSSDDPAWANCQYWLSALRHNYLVKGWDNDDSQAKRREFVHRANRMAVESHYGNCEVQAAAAFYYVKNAGMKGVAHIRLFQFNHHFAVLGLTSPPAGGRLLYLNGDSPFYDSPDAVICDPWCHQWFEAKDEWSRMRTLVGEGTFWQRPQQNAYMMVLMDYF